MENNPQDEYHLQGSPVSDGIAIGTLVLLEEDEFDDSRPSQPPEVEKEIDRYRKALHCSREDLEKLQNELSLEGSSEASSIIATHIQMLHDPMITTHVEEMIRRMNQSTETVFRSFIQDYQERLGRHKDGFFQQRLIDVVDLSNRILRHLSPRPKLSFADLPPNSVVVAKELAPSDTASAQASRVSAFVTQRGGGSSHSALIARAKGIPFVSRIDLQQLKHVCGKHVIVNGLTGDVIVNPNEGTIEKYRELQRLLQQQSQELEQELFLPSETKDGHPIALYANIGEIEEWEMVHSVNALGVGLFRTEFLLSEDKEILSSEEKQLSLYRKAVASSKGLPLVVRAFDLGGDKFPDIVLEQEQDVEVLSWCRGIRFLLRYPHLFKVQIRALLRAAVDGDIRFLLPLVSDCDELIKTRALMQQAREELVSQNIAVGNLSVGCMIEVPAAVMVCKELAQESDFFSIGTNDLIQYLLGMDRSDLEKNDCYYPAHPSVVRMLYHIVKGAKKLGRGVTLCGEMASNPHFIPLLLGLGIESFSCAPRYLPIIKRIIRHTDRKKAVKLAKKVLALPTQARISSELKKTYHQILGF